MLPTGEAEDYLSQQARWLPSRINWQKRTLSFEYIHNSTVDMAQQSEMALHDIQNESHERRNISSWI
jgi:hypothetical protein